MIFTTALNRIGDKVSMRRMSWPAKAHVSYFEKREGVLGLMFHDERGREREFEPSDADLNAIDWNITEEL
jgi:hypothetical protein